MAESSDRDLVARMRAGDDAAFETVFRAHYGMVCDVAYAHVHSRADAEEIAQSVLLAFWQQRARLELRSTLRAYLLRATRNHALNRSGRARLEQRWLEESAGDAPDLHGTPPRAPDDVVQAQETAARVRAALDTLPPGARRVLELRWEQQLHIAEIAEVLGISVKGVENQLTRARNALRQRLADLLE